MKELKEITKELEKLNLKRYPNQELLRAWDAADELIIQKMQTMELEGLKIIIVNDAFGALTRYFQHLDVTTYIDSYLSLSALRLNNPIKKFKLISELDDIKENYDLIVIKIPKNLSFLREILNKFSSLSPKSNFISAGMAKYLTRNTYNLYTHTFKDANISLTQKKAKLIFSSNAIKIQKKKINFKEVLIDKYPYKVINYSNVFSREKLDIGTRFLLENLPQNNYKYVLDLGCGNGILGINLKNKQSDSIVYFSDESKMAIQSANQNYNLYFKDKAHFFWTHSTLGIKQKFDLVICNPPFHQNNTIMKGIAINMFKDSKKVLLQFGALRVVANRHLNYHIVLKKIYGNVKLINQNSKFVILESINK